MAYDKTLVADSVVQRLIENQGIYQSVNRSFDGLARQGASSIDVPALADVVVKKSSGGIAVASADRKKAKADTTMVNIPLVDYAVPLAEEILAQFETNGMLIKQYLDSASMKLQEQFDADVIAAAQGTTDRSVFDGEVLTWKDITNINARMDKNKVPKTGRIIVVSANLADEFYNIDVIKSSLGYNQNFLQSGTLINLLGMKFFVSGLVEQLNIGGLKDNMVGIYGPGLAFVLSRFGELKQAWDTTNLQTINDMLAHAGVKLFNDKFAVVKYKNAA
jgi:hypothetical protein